MLKLLRFVFFLVLLIGFLVSCRHRKEEQVVLKSASQPAPGKSSKKMPAPSAKKDWPDKLQETLGLSKKEMQGKLYRFVTEWYGVPYRYGGCQKSGVDCSCFASILCEKVYGYSLPRRASDIFKSCKQFGIDQAKEGDLVFFTIGSSNVTHVGIYLRKKYFVHASTSRGVMVNSLNEAYYKKYFLCAGRLKEA